MKPFAIVLALAAALPVLAQQDTVTARDAWARPPGRNAQHDRRLHDT